MGSQKYTSKLFTLQLFDYCLTLAFILILSSSLFELSHLSLRVFEFVGILVSPLFLLFLFKHLRVSPGNFLSFLIHEAYRRPEETWKRTFFKIATSFLVVVIGVSASINLLLRKSDLKPIASKISPLGISSNETLSPQEQSFWDPIDVPYFLFWIKAPVYRALGGVPSLPYVIGPPNRFLAKVFIQSTDYPIEFAISGPTTLKSFKDLDTVHACLSRFADCLSTRVELLQQIIPTYVGDLKTLDVNLTPLPDKNSKKNYIGIWVRSKAIRTNTAENSTHDFMVGFFIVRENGTVQAVIAKTNTSALFEETNRRLNSFIESIDMSETLKERRTFLEQKLQESTFAEKKPAELLRAYNLLLSITTLNPKSYDAFYHLGGVSRLLLQLAQYPNDNTLAVSNDDVELLRFLRNNGPAFKRTLQSTAKFAQDINPNDPRTEELLSFVRVAL